MNEIVIRDEKVNNLFWRTYAYCNGKRFMLYKINSYRSRKQLYTLTDENGKTLCTRGTIETAKDLILKNSQN